MNGRVFRCYHPKDVFNPYIGDNVVVRCGKCNACRNERANHWVTRCDLESACHKYTLFTTLTYDDFNVPQIVRLRKEDYNYPAYIDCQTGEIFDMRDIHEEFSDSDKEYLSNTKVLNVISVRDIQLFLKRLRYEFTKIDKTARLRYYFAFEYGPRTFRPHGHLLLWFDNERCASKIEVLLSKAWSYGRVFDPHFVTGSAAQYVASYINSLSSLPKVYLHKRIRPCTLKSSSPAIGSLYPLLGDEQDQINGGNFTFRRYDSKANEFKDVPLWRTLENRLYPRLQRFGCLSHDDRVALYRKVAEFYESKNFTAVEIARRIQWEYIDKRRKDFFGRYFYEITHKYKFGIHFTKQTPDGVEDYTSLPFLPYNFCLSRPFFGIKEITREFCFDSLVRFVRTCSRLLKNCKNSGYNIDEYVSKIEEYYDKKSHYLLKKDFQFQNEYFSSHPLWHYIYFDKSFYDKVTTTDKVTWSVSTHKTLSYLFNSSQLPLKDKILPDGNYWQVLDIPSFDKLDDYIHLRLLHDKIAHDLVKQKENNDYALLHKDKYYNVIKYQNLIS